MEDAGVDPGRIDAVVFDVIGTLVNEDAAWMRAAERLGAEAGVTDTADLRTVWGKLLDRRMAAVVDGDAPWQPHRVLVVDAAREAIARTGGSEPAVALAAIPSLDGEYPAWPDVASATDSLRRHRVVAGLSNGDLDALARLANANAISWDVALSTGSVRTFKPAPAAYRYAIDALLLDPGRTLFVAAHPWDLRAASRHGCRTAYGARPGAERPSAEDRFDVVVEDVSALAALLAEPPRRGRTG